MNDGPNEKDPFALEKSNGEIWRPSIHWRVQNHDKHPKWSILRE